MRPPSPPGAPSQRRNLSKQSTPRPGRRASTIKATSFPKLVLRVGLAASVFLALPRLASSYTLEGATWRRGTIPMMIQVGVPSFVLPDGFLSWPADAENALAQWNQQIGSAQFTWVEALPGTIEHSGDYRNSVLFSNTVFGKSFGSDVLAITLFVSSGSQMLEADVIFNNHDLGGSGIFSSGQNVSPQRDFHRVALHEFGHVLGLGHPDQANPKQTVSAIMNSRVSSLNHLTADDINGARSLYGTPSTPPAGPQLSNISTRARAATRNDVLIAGFILQSQGKQILLRALGPTLAQFGVSGFLADPTISLFDSNGSLIASNNNWKETQQAQIEQTGLAPSSDLEPAILITLQPANYTAIVSGTGGDSGVAVAEVYDLQTTIGRASNISSRAQVANGENVVIAGFAVQGPQLKSVVLRGIGPGLQGVVPDPLPNMTIELHNSQGQLIESNADWKNGETPVARPNGSPVSPTYLDLYHLAPPNDNDSALYNQLAPGNYTVIFKSPTDATGNGLVEIYGVDP